MAGGLAGGLADELVHRLVRRACPTSLSTGVSTGDCPRIRERAGPPGGDLVHRLVHREGAPLIFTDWTLIFREGACYDVACPPGGPTNHTNGTNGACYDVACPPGRDLPQRHRGKGERRLRQGFDWVAGAASPSRIARRASDSQGSRGSPGPSPRSEVAKLPRVLPRDLSRPFSLPRELKRELRSSLLPCGNGRGRLFPGDDDARGAKKKGPARRIGAGPKP